MCRDRNTSSVQLVHWIIEFGGAVLSDGAKRWAIPLVPLDRDRTGITGKLTQAPTQSCCRRYSSGVLAETLSAKYTSEDGLSGSTSNHRTGLGRAGKDRTRPLVFHEFLEVISDLRACVLVSFATTEAA